ncbi:hypothetical protein [Aliiruegeria lutimaris]|uniref:hypothetical protein n=1 Tax=Aliiruegeria lutimaris TaxID=571298 RepID=UPI000B860961|nr:hypothetical protein [Aliiruegeria lutimaris]
MEREVPQRYGWTFLGVFRPGERVETEGTYSDFPFDGLCNAAADFVAREFWIISDADVPVDTRGHFVCDLLLPNLLSRDGHLVLHCGMVAFENAAIGFLGPSGAGKSTMTAAFVRHGAELLSDDAIMIDPEADPLGARPLYSGMRMFSGSISAILPDVPLGENMAHYSSKQRLKVDGSTEMAHPRACSFWRTTPRQEKSR